MLEFLKFWGCRKKNVGVQKEEAEEGMQMQGEFVGFF